MKRVPYERPPDLTESGVLKRLQKQADMRRQVVAKIKASATGLKRLLGSVDLQIIAQAPNRLFLEVQSFFNQPMQVITSDGINLYWLDLSDIDHPRMTIDVSGSTRISDLLGIKLTPEEIVDLSLGVAPLFNATIKEIDFEPIGNVYTVTLQKKGGRRFNCTFRTMDDTILQCDVYNKDSSFAYNVKYEDFRSMGLLSVAHQWILNVQRNGKEHRLQMVALELNMNTPPFPLTIFQQEAP